MDKIKKCFCGSENVFLQEDKNIFLVKIMVVGIQSQLLHKTMDTKFVVISVGCKHAGGI